MLQISISGIIKYLIGIVLVQSATAILVMVALRMNSHEGWLLLGLLALTLGLLTALWFSSISSQARKEAVAQVREGFSREREKIRVRAEREKSKLIEKNHQRMIKDRNRSQVKSNIRSGAVFAGALALGGILAFTQFFTFGLLLMGTAGGAIAGYLLRSRQLLLGQRHKPALEAKPTSKFVGENLNGGP